MNPARCGAGGSHGCGATDYCRFDGRGSASGVGRDLSNAHRTGESCGAGRHYSGLSRRAFGLCRGAGDGGNNKSTNGDEMLAARRRTGSVGGAGRPRPARAPGDDYGRGQNLTGRAGLREANGGAVAHSIPKRFGKSRIVEDPDLSRRKKSRHSLRIAGARQRAGDDDPVVAGEHPGEAPAVTLCQKLPHAALPLRVSPTSILSCLVPALPA